VDRIVIPAQRSKPVGIRLAEESFNALYLSNLQRDAQFVLRCWLDNSSLKVYNIIKSSRILPVLVGALSFSKGL